MATDFDNFPVYDPLVKGDGKFMSEIWIASLSYFIQSLSSYLSSRGVFVPRETSTERNEIKDPQKGQLIYNTTVDRLQVWDGSWKDLVVSNNGILVPTLTTAERDAISSPTNGQLIYNSTTNKFQGYEGGAWVNLV